MRRDYPNSDTDSHGHTNYYAYGHADLKPDSYANRYTDGHTYSYCDADSYGNGHADCYSDCYTRTNVRAERSWSHHLWLQVQQQPPG